MFRDTIVKSPSADRMAASSEWQLAGRPRNELPMLTDRAWLEIERAAKVAETHGVTIDLWHHGLEHIQ
eukprot:gene2658-5499_t